MAGRFAVAATVVAEHLIARGERRDLIAPDVQVLGPPVDEDDRGSLPGELIVDRGVADVHPRRLRSHATAGSGDHGQRAHQSAYHWGLPPVGDVKMRSSRPTRLTMAANRALRRSGS